MYFLDTSVVMSSTIPFDHYNDKAQTFFMETFSKNNTPNKYQWVTCPEVIEEILYLTHRRNELYKKIIHFNFVTDIKVEDLYKIIFKSLINQNRNDEYHLQNLFNTVISGMGLTSKSIVNNAKFNLFCSKCFPLITKIRINQGKIHHYLKQPQNSSKIVNCQKDSKYKKMRKVMFKKIKCVTKYNKNDINILLNAVGWGNDSTNQIDFVSCDGFFQQIEQILYSQLKNIYNSKFVKIVHLKDLN